MSPHSFVYWLNATPQARRLSPTELAREGGVSGAQISRWRRGQMRHSLHHLQRLADTFDVPPATLDRLAGYPVADAPGEEISGPGDPDRQAEHQASQAWYGQLLEHKLPRGAARCDAPRGVPPVADTEHDHGGSIGF